MTIAVFGGARRMQRETHTVEAMIRMYCTDHHTPVAAGPLSGAASAGARGLCEECGVLLRYAQERATACPFGEGKPTCVRCTVHCYRAAEREKIRTVMRYSGPRMSYRHPYLALRHLLDRRRGPGARRSESGPRDR